MSRSIQDNHVCGGERWGLHNVWRGLAVDAVLDTAEDGEQAAAPGLSREERTWSNAGSCAVGAREPDLCFGLRSKHVVGSGNDGVSIHAL
jgi:hypothetical protein